MPANSATASQPLQALPDVFGLEDVDVIDDDGTMLLHVLWDSAATGTGVDETLLVRVERDEGWNLSLAAWDISGGLLRDDIRLLAPIGLHAWVECNHQVWERCRAEWARYLEWREP